MKLPFVLSGGGVRGVAHLGVLKAFAEKDIFPGVISATSAGAITGALVCDGYAPDEILELSKKNRFYGFEFPFSLLHLASLNPLHEFLSKNLRHKNFEELPVPLYVTATSLLDGKQKVFDHGDIVSAVVAACSIPLIFHPIVIDDVPYMDGGIASNLPVEPLTGKYENIIGVYVNPLPDYNERASNKEYIDRLMHLCIRENVREQMACCALFIEPPGLVHYGVFDESRKQEVFEVGYNYAKEFLNTSKEARQFIARLAGNEDVTAAAFGRDYNI